MNIDREKMAEQKAHNRVAQSDSLSVDALKAKLRELIAMWAEVARVNNLVGMRSDAAVLHDCIDDLEELLGGF